MCLGPTSALCHFFSFLMKVKLVSIDFTTQLELMLQIKGIYLDKPSFGHLLEFLDKSHHEKVD